MIYVFVNLNTYDNQYGEPEYYVAWANEIIDKIKEYTNRGILQYGQLKKASEQFLDKWDKIS